MIKLIPEIVEFIKWKTINQWFENDVWKVYVRKQKQFDNGKLRVILCLASVEVYDKWKWTFTKFLTWIENLWYTIYIENVLNPRLEIFFSKRNWYKRINEICFIKEWKDIF